MIHNRGPYSVQKYSAIVVLKKIIQKNLLYENRGSLYDLTRDIYNIMLLFCLNQQMIPF